MSKGHGKGHRGKHVVHGMAHMNSKLDWEKVRYIRTNPHISIKTLADMYKVAPTTIRQVRDGYTWKENL